jgi:hypothetical protein
MLGKCHFGHNQRLCPFTLERLTTFSIGCGGQTKSSNNKKKTLKNVLLVELNSLLLLHQKKTLAKINHSQKEKNCKSWPKKQIQISCIKSLTQKNPNPCNKSKFLATNP